jgi:hypothetical protein
MIGRQEETMAPWRLLGELPQARSREEIQGQSIGGWNPWRFVWSPLDEPVIVVPNPRDPSRHCHVHISESGQAGSAMKFAALVLDDSWCFYVPAAEGADGSFEAVEAKYEGFWRGTQNEAADLPWPIPAPLWSGRGALIEALDRAEFAAERIAYRGYSRCRICGRQNGHESLRLAEWEWPAGYRHYIAEHFVRPSPDFERFIMRPFF